MVPSIDNMFNDTSATSVCPDCLDSVNACTCSWQISQLDASYSIYTALNDDMNKSTPITSDSSPNFVQKVYCLFLQIINTCIDIKSPGIFVSYNILDSERNEKNY